MFNVKSILVYTTVIIGRDNVVKTGPLRCPDSLEVSIYDDDEVVISTTGKIDPSSPMEYQRPYLIEKLSKISEDSSGSGDDRKTSEHALLCEMQIRGVDPKTKSFRNRIRVQIYENGDVSYCATDDPVDADVVQKLIEVLQRRYGSREVTS
jgi:hypothetical protein